MTELQLPTVDILTLPGLTLVPPLSHFPTPLSALPEITSQRNYLHLNLNKQQRLSSCMRVQCIMASEPSLSNRHISAQIASWMFPIRTYPPVL